MSKFSVATQQELAALRAGLTLLAERATKGPIPFDSELARILTDGGKHSGLPRRSLVQAIGEMAKYSLPIVNFVDPVKLVRESPVGAAQIKQLLSQAVEAKANYNNAMSELETALMQGQKGVMPAAESKELANRVTKLSNSLADPSEAYFMFPGEGALDITDNLSEDRSTGAGGHETTPVSPSTTAPPRTDAFCTAVVLLGNGRAQDLSDSEIDRCFAQAGGFVSPKLRDQVRAARDDGTLTMHEVAASINELPECLQSTTQDQRDYLNDSLANWENTDDDEMMELWKTEGGLTEEQAQAAIKFRDRCLVDMAFVPFPAVESSDETSASAPSMKG